MNNLVTYQKIQLLVNECQTGDAVRDNPTLLSSSVSVLFCVCNSSYTGILNQILSIYMYILFFFLCFRSLL